MTLAGVSTCNSRHDFLLGSSSRDVTSFLAEGFGVAEPVTKQKERNLHPRCHPGEPDVGMRDPYVNYRTVIITR